MIATQKIINRLGLLSGHLAAAAAPVDAASHNFRPPLKQQHTPPKMHETVVESITNDYDQVYTFRVQPGGDATFTAGQYCHLRAPGMEGKGGGKGSGKQGVRHMSFASSPLEPQLMFSMDLSSGSEFKQRFAALQPGQTMKFFKTKGEFTLAPEVSDIVFIAGGIGITPIRSLIMDIEMKEKPVSWQLLHVARTGHLYQSELEMLTAPQNRTDRAGCAAALKNIVARKPTAHYYMSGSDGFVQDLKQQLLDLGVPEAKVCVENFHH